MKIGKGDIKKNEKKKRESRRMKNTKIEISDTRSSKIHLVEIMRRKGRVEIENTARILIVIKGIIPGVKRRYEVTQR